MSSFYEKVLPITQTFKEWLSDTFAKLIHYHTTEDITDFPVIIDSRPDWSRATEYSLGTSSDASRGPVYQINANGYLFITNKTFGSSGNDGDGAYIAATCVEPLLTSNISYMYDMFIISGSTADGADNMVIDTVPVTMEHPWFIRYHSTYNDILANRLFFIPCMSQEVTDYLQLVYDNSEVAKDHYTNFMGVPSHCILPTNGYQIINFNNTHTEAASMNDLPLYLNTPEATYKYYGYTATTSVPLYEFTKDTTFVTGTVYYTANEAKTTFTKYTAWTAGTAVPADTYYNYRTVTKYTYKYTITGAATSGNATYSSTKDTTMEGYNASYNYQYINTLSTAYNELWIENIENKWRYVFHSRYIDAAPLYNREGTSSTVYTDTVVDRPYDHVIIEYSDSTADIRIAAASTAYEHLNGNVNGYRCATALNSLTADNRRYAGYGPITDTVILADKTYYQFDRTTGKYTAFSPTVGSTVPATALLSNYTSANVPDPDVLYYEAGEYKYARYWRFYRYYTIYSDVVDFGQFTQSISRFAELLLFNDVNTTVVVDKRNAPTAYAVGMNNTHATYPRSYLDGFNRISSSLKGTADNITYVSVYEGVEAGAAFGYGEHLTNVE